MSVYSCLSLLRRACPPSLLRVLTRRGVAFAWGLLGPLLCLLAALAALAARWTLGWTLWLVTLTTLLIDWLIRLIHYRLLISRHRTSFCLAAPAVS